MEEEAEDLAPPGDEEALRARAARQLRIRSNFARHLLTSGIVVAVLFVVLSMTGVLASGLLFIPWIIAAAWAAGLTAEGIGAYYATGARAAQRTAQVHQALSDAYGPYWYRDASLAQQRVVRARIIEPQRRRSELARQGVYFVFINALLWFIWAFLTPQSPPWPLIPTVAWGLALLIGALGLSREQAREPDIEREVERQRALMDSAMWDGEKPKNDMLDADDGPAMTVGPDGELIELESADDDSPKQKRR